jgi:hypothetical protein
MRIPPRFPVLVVPIMALLTAPPPALAQDVQYETVTRMSVPGAAGTAMRVAARLSGAPLETVEKTFISGNRMRTDTDGSSTIIDLDAATVTFLDHQRRTFTTVSFDEMAAAARQAAHEVEAAAMEAREGRREAGPDHADVRLTFRLNVDNPGERDRLHGYTAERFFVTMEAEGEAPVDEGEDPEEAGTFVVLSDLWVSTEVPAYAAQRTFGEASAQTHAAAASSLADALTAALAEDPEMKVAFEQAAAEAARLEGMPLRSTMTFVAVPVGMAFDREAAINPEAGTGVAAAVGRAALGGLRQRAAAAVGRQAEQRDEQHETARQRTLLTVTSEVRNLSTSPLPAGTFAIPSGYSEAAFDAER